MGVDIRVIHATGGAAVNTSILQVMADVFGADVYPCADRNTACLGAALRAWHADAAVTATPVSWADVTRDLAQPSASHVVHPRLDATAVYADLRTRYAAHETRLRAQAI
jgi:xylulokinase